MRDTAAAANLPPKLSLSLAFDVAAVAAKLEAGKEETKWMGRLEKTAHFLALSLSSLLSFIIIFYTTAAADDGSSILFLLSDY